MSTADDARAKLEAGDPAGALAVAQAGLESEPDSVELLRIAGRAGVETGADDAVDRLRRVTELEPEDAGSWRDLGDALATEGKKEEADAAFRKVLEIAPDDEMALTAVGHGAFAGGDGTDAVAFLEQAAERSEGNTTAVISLVEMYKTLGKLDQALEAAQRVEENEPDSPLAILDVAELSLELDRPDEAAAAFGRLRDVADFPEHEVAALHGLVRVELARGDTSAALEHARQARSVDTVGRTRGVLAHLEAETGGDEALQALARDASGPMLAVIEAPPTRAEVDSALDSTLADLRRDLTGGPEGGSGG
jgi:tetratricopeptide (TPR) repeat protein